MFDLDWLTTLLILELAGKNGSDFQMLAKLEVS